MWLSGLLWTTAPSGTDKNQSASAAATIPGSVLVKYHRVRKIDTVGTITTITTGEAGWTAVDAAGNLHMAVGVGSRIRRFDAAAGIVAMLADDNNTAIDAQIDNAK